MNKTTKDMIEVMQASLEGKQIEQLYRSNSMSLWEPKAGQGTWWDWASFDYRIKKEEPKRVPLSREDIKPGDCIKDFDCWLMIIGTTVDSVILNDIDEGTYTNSFKFMFENGHKIRSIGETEWRDCWKVEE